MDSDKLPENLKDALCKAEKRSCEYYCKYEPETNNIIIAIRHNITHASINLKIPTHMLFNNSPDVLHSIMLIEKFTYEQNNYINSGMILSDTLENKFQLHYNGLDSFIPGVGISIDKSLFEMYNEVKSKVKARGNFKIDIEKFVDVMIQLGIVTPNEEDEED